MRLLPLDALETENLRKLLVLLQKVVDSIPQDEPAGAATIDLGWRISDRLLEIGEIQRELGLFEEALESLARVGDSHSRKAAKLIELARSQQTHLVKFESSP